MIFRTLELKYYVHSHKLVSCVLCCLNVNSELRDMITMQMSIILQRISVGY